MTSIMCASLLMPLNCQRMQADAGFRPILPKAQHPCFDGIPSSCDKPETALAGLSKARPPDNLERFHFEGEP